ncbi:Na(+)/H(+) antiporter subunit [Saliniradius amylolyticus]|uniref:Na(+)/H(+) antiporter subunit n=1 Tax=Saliniradius amylolyticus TaxID=2183582 RepID=A0A2S2E1I2_9ALTE|nr:Na+/H+ antiporter subunit G [Saliniradius amylolyticus]AWL11382.1 Na(+)/H(+) antiporter subunit [Saliniradius amylolyticus]
MIFWIELIASLFLVVGGLFVLVGSIGLIRLPDLYCRLHAPTKATTVGLGGMLMASMVVMSYRHDVVSVHEFLISLFLIITAPVTAHMLAKTAMHHRDKAIAKTARKEYIETAREQLPPESEQQMDKKD